MLRSAVTDRLQPDAPRAIGQLRRGADSLAPAVDARERAGTRRLSPWLCHFQIRPILRRLGENSQAIIVVYSRIVAGETSFRGAISAMCEPWVVPPPSPLILERIESLGRNRAVDWGTREKTASPPGVGPASVSVQPARESRPVPPISSNSYK